MSTYELRVYEIASEKMAVIGEIFRDLVMPMLTEYSMESFGYWHTPDESTFYYVVRHESLKAIAGNWERFHADPRWMPGLAARERGQTIVMNTKSVPLVGFAGLPP